MIGALTEREPGRGAAAYNNRGWIQQNQPTQNADGQQVQNWVDIAQDWFQIVPKGGHEKKVFEQLRAECTHVVRVRSSRTTRAIMPADYRLRFSDPDGGPDQVLNIESKIDIGTRRTELQFECIEVQV